MEEVMRNLKEISTKLSSKTEKSQDVRVESCSWCGENGHNASWCPYNSNQEEGFEHINMVNSTMHDDALDTILQALDDLKEGNNRLESKLENLSSRRRLEDQEEHNQHMHQQEEDKYNVLGTKDFLEFKRFWEFHLGKTDYAESIQSEVSTNDFSINDLDDSLSDVGIILNEEEEEELDGPLINQYFT